MYFKIYKNVNYIQSYWWVVKSSNQATLAKPGMYLRKVDCIAAINLVKLRSHAVITYDQTGEK